MPPVKRLLFTSVPALVTALGLTTILLIASLAGWWALGPETRNQMTGFQVATLAGVVIILMAVMMSVGYSRLWADEDGVTVRNGPVLRRFRIDEVVGTRLRPGDAWAYLLVKREGKVDKYPVLAIQQLEREGAKHKLRELRAWLTDNGASSEGVTNTED